jgi:RNA polymerase sigma factor (sigma-70 family)
MSRSMQGCATLSLRERDKGDSLWVPSPIRCCSSQERNPLLVGILSHEHMSELPIAGKLSSDSELQSADLAALFHGMQSSDPTEAENAWGECFRLYKAKVWSRVFFVLATIPWLKEPKEVAMDVTSEIFARLPKSVRHYREAGRAEPWLMRIAVRAALREKESITGMWSKKGSRRIGVELNEETVAEIENLLEVEERDARLELSRRMEEWSADPEKATWIRFVTLFLEGYGHEEIAQQLGIAVGTSRTLLWKIRCELGRQPEEKRK